MNRQALDELKQQIPLMGYTFANFLGSGSDVIKNYRANGIPLVILIDKDGVVRYVHRGWSTGIDLTPEVKKLIER